MVDNLLNLRAEPVGEVWLSTVIPMATITVHQRLFFFSRRQPPTKQKKNPGSTHLENLVRNITVWLQEFSAVKVVNAARALTGT